ncbi:threonine aldolase family protein [Novispirillum sp. DQ9]|uniref:threonine aldolase family protein n=1 Tax=Novispirillum sp. DQ9 TaxID=3398612 RepID=UPI003C7D9D19
MPTVPAATSINLASDNVTGCCPAVRAALDAAAEGTAPSYAADPWTARAEAALRETFAAPDLRAFLVTSGTAANALALALLTPPFGSVLCHADSHINADEAGAPEFYTGGAKLLPVAGPTGKLTPDACAAVYAHATARGVHRAPPSVLSLTQATEVGTLYQPKEIAALAAFARERGMAVHMDGARLANAVAALGLPPADVTWRAGVDVLSFGATKNGAWACEAVVVFDPARVPALDALERRRMRGGHLLSKGRFLGAQMVAYLEDGLWLANAAHANAMAARLGDGLARLGHPPVLPVQANAVFAALPAPVRRRLSDASIIAAPWTDLGPDTLRFVCAFDTPPEVIDRVLEVVAG